MAHGFQTLTTRVKEVNIAKKKGCFTRICTTGTNQLKQWRSFFKNHSGCSCTEPVIS